MRQNRMRKREQKNLTILIKMAEIEKKKTVKRYWRAKRAQKFRNIHSAKFEKMFYFNFENQDWGALLVCGYVNNLPS